jgi:Phosphomannose isomerase
MRTFIDGLLSEGNGVLRLEPCWVARDLVPPGRRLGLPEDAYDVGERGFICERWLASTTLASHEIGPEDEGLSYLQVDGARVKLRDVVAAAPDAILGHDYAATHAGLGRLAKIFDYADRLPYHLHPRSEHARLVGRNPKDEAYYFPEGFDMGPHPESFLGLHPLFRDPAMHDVLLPYLIDWNGDGILGHAPGYLQVPTEGFHIPSGVLHAPGTAVTIELQEDSDTYAMLQALNAGRIISKRHLFKDVRPEDEARYGERFILQLIDWELNADPDFYASRHLRPLLRDGSVQPHGEESWIYYNTTKFSGTKVVVRPGGSYRASDPGVYTVFVLSGSGSFGGLAISGGSPGSDELLVCHEAAKGPIEIRNDSSTDDLVLIKFFGPDVNADVPSVSSRPR